jgi:pyrroline-5-carboxylate reductase
MKIGFIGCGRMAEAIISSLISSRIVGAHQVSASDISKERREEVKARHGINLYTRNNLIPEIAEVLFLAVKPQQLGSVLEGIAGQVTDKHLVISIAAGKAVSFVESALPAARVIRVMPNLPCTVGEGMSVFCAGSKATPTDKQKTEKLLGSFGKVLQLPEEAFDAVTAMSGSGPAFFTYYLAKMVSAGVKAGLRREDALLLAEQTMLGTSKLLISKGTRPEDLIEAVASSKGTTAAGLDVLRSSDLHEIVNKTIEAAANRSRELSS